MNRIMKYFTTSLLRPVSLLPALQARLLHMRIISNTHRRKDSQRYAGACSQYLPLTRNRHEHNTKLHIHDSKKSSSRHHVTKPPSTHEKATCEASNPTCSAHGVEACILACPSKGSSTPLPRQNQEEKKQKKKAPDPDPTATVPVKEEEERSKKAHSPNLSIAHYHFRG
jgi:hypothetical protein